jgi:hypothetical protein
MWCARNASMRNSPEYLRSAIGQDDLDQLGNGPGISPGGVYGMEQLREMRPEPLVTAGGLPPAVYSKAKDLPNFMKPAIAFLGSSAT